MTSEVTRDLFAIAKRLRQINPNYGVFYNNKEHRYEVHENGFLSFAVPFEQLDARTLEYAHKTKKENFDSMVNEIEAHNAQIQNDAYRGARAAAARFADMMDFAARANHAVTFTSPMKWY